MERAPAHAAAKGDGSGRFRGRPAGTRAHRARAAAAYFRGCRPSRAAGSAGGAAAKRHMDGRARRAARPAPSDAPGCPDGHLSAQRIKSDTPFTYKLSKRKEARKCEQTTATPPAAACHCMLLHSPTSLWRLPSSAAFQTSLARLLFLLAFHSIVVASNRHEVVMTRFRALACHTAIELGLLRHGLS